MCSKGRRAGVRPPRPLPSPPTGDETVPATPVALIVPADAAGERLDVFLAPHAGSRSAAQKVIEAGRVTVDGVRRSKRHVLGGGEAVAVAEVAPVPEAPVPEAEFRIAWEDEYLLVVDKPAG